MARRLIRQGYALPYRQVTIEVVVPVHNEEAALPHSIPRLCNYLETYFPYRWSVVIADNASTDSTLAVARELAADKRVSVLHLKQKGRGRGSKLPGSPRRPTSSPTWTSTFRPTFRPSCRWSHLWPAGTATWPSARAS